MKHTPGPWKVVPCPVHGGKHPLHDSRWIMTADAEIEYSPNVPNDWTLSKGSRICMVMDSFPAGANARLIAEAPNMLEVLRQAQLAVQYLENHSEIPSIVADANMLNDTINTLIAKIEEVEG